MTYIRKALPRAAALAALLGGATIALAQSGPPEVAAQVLAGRTDYAVHCASCHGERLNGQIAGALSGPAFLSRWGGDTGTAADLYGTTTEEIRAGSNGRRAVRARMLSCWMLRETGKSFPEIARQFGQDHTTAIHACRVIGRDEARVALGRRLLAEEVAA